MTWNYSIVNHQKARALFMKFMAQSRFSKHFRVWTDIKSEIANIRV